LLDYQSAIDNSIIRVPFRVVARVRAQRAWSCELLMLMQMRRTANSRVGSMTAIWQVVKKALKEEIKK
jgi:hypothetical protein